jgi:hypothetical protein
VGGGLLGELVEVDIDMDTDADVLGKDVNRTLVKISAPHL